MVVDATTKARVSEKNIGRLNSPNSVTLEWIPLYELNCFLHNPGQIGQMGSVNASASLSGIPNFTPTKPLVHPTGERDERGGNERDADGLESRLQSASPHYHARFAQSQSIRPGYGREDFVKL